MPIYQRTNPVDIDAIIVDFNTYLYGAVGYSDWDAFDRANAVERSGKGKYPQYYIDGVDSTDSLFNDNRSITTFFFRDGDEKKVDDGYEASVSMIAQVNLSKVKPLITHRADEEVLHDFKLAIESGTNPYSNNFELLEVIHDIDKVYREFDKTLLRYDDMSERHIFRLKFKVTYDVTRSFC